jgi:thiamine-phosphate diphosphorylase
MVLDFGLQDKRTLYIAPHRTENLILAIDVSQLRYYFITDDGKIACSPIEQVRIALNAGADMIQYRNKGFHLGFFQEVAAIHALCRQWEVPLVINDNILLAKAVQAEGVHLGQGDDSPLLARQVLGSGVIVGLTVPTLEALERSPLEGCDYIGHGPVFGTSTKADAKPRCGLESLKAMAACAPKPVVAIGGITAANAGACFQNGAAGVAVISAITRSSDPAAAAHQLAVAIQAAL